MLIIGAIGFAKEVLETLILSKSIDDIVFYDDINPTDNNLLFRKYTVFTNQDQVLHYFKTKDSRFTIGIGNPVLRKKMYEKFMLLGRELASIISDKTNIGSHEVVLGDFVKISPAAVLLGRCNIGNFTLIGSNATVLHDISIEQNVIVAAGAVVTKDVPVNCVVTGIPARIEKTINPLNF